MKMCKHSCGREAQSSGRQCKPCENSMVRNGRPAPHTSTLTPGRHSNWRGEAVGYWAVHRRLRRDLGPAKQHPCSGRECSSAGYDWAYQGGAVNEMVGTNGKPYSTDPGDYAPMCRKCHRRSEREQEILNA